MESSKLKNIILIILVVTNLFLLLLMFAHRLESGKLAQKPLDDAVALLGESGIWVDREALPQGEFPHALELERDSGWERQVFTSLLGEGTSMTQRGLVYLYSGPRGEAEVRGDGAFEVTLSPGAYPLGGGDRTQLALEVLTLLDIRGEALSQEGNSLTLRLTYAGDSGPSYPIHSCAITCVFDDSSLLSLSGTRLTGTPLRDSAAGEPLSLPTLLVRFRAGILDSGDACAAITSATQGYTLAADAAGGLRLTPVLLVETDTNRYLINALNGEFTRS